jgi:L-lactate dehydrogenase complex protein LldE
MRQTRPDDEQVRVRIALFVTCLGDAIYPEVGRATVEVLERLGHEVVFPAEQTCCGQMHVNSGYRDDAARLARRYVDVFGPSEVVVTPSASCAGCVRDLYPDLLGERPPVLDRVYELSELLVRRLGVEDVGAAYARRVAYHPTCHSLRVTRVGDVPLRLLGNVRGLELAEVRDAEECCGFGGTFALKNADTSSAMLADKCTHLAESGAEVCTAVDGSCLLHIGGGLSRRGSTVRTVHLAEILASRD